jgi:hypothetical protein
MLGEITPPPPLPDGVRAYGGEWFDAAKTWTAVADVMDLCEVESVRQSAQRLREYAATQLV